MDKELLLNTVCRPLLTRHLAPVPSWLLSGFSVLYLKYLDSSEWVVDGAQAGFGAYDQCGHLWYWALTPDEIALYAAEDGVQILSLH